MKKNHIWIVVTSKGEPILQTVSFDKNESIDIFCYKYGIMLWEEATEIGYRCAKFEEVRDDKY